MYPYLGIVGYCYYDEGGENPRIKLALWEKTSSSGFGSLIESDWDTGSNEG